MNKISNMVTLVIVLSKATLYVGCAKEETEHVRRVGMVI
jgi:hypothetical protein